MAIQETLTQVKTQATDFGTQLKSQAEAGLERAQELGKAAADAAVKGGTILRDGVQELVKLEGDAIKGGYAAVLQQLKPFAEVRDLEGLKAAANGAELTRVGSDFAEQAAKGGDVVTRATNELGELIGALGQQFSAEAAPAVEAVEEVVEKAAEEAPKPAKKAATKAKAKTGTTAKKKTTTRKAPAKKAAAAK